MSSSGDDCGVFLCVCADSLMRGQTLDHINQKYIYDNNCRTGIAVTLLNRCENKEDLICSARNYQKCASNKNYTTSVVADGSVVGSLHNSNHNNDSDEEDTSFLNRQWDWKPKGPDAAMGGQEAGLDRDDLWAATGKALEQDEAHKLHQDKRQKKKLAEIESATAARKDQYLANKKMKKEAAQREADYAKEAAREKTLEEVNSVQKTVDLGDEQRRLYEEFEAGFEEQINDNDSTGSHDYGF